MSSHHDDELTRWRRAFAAQTAPPANPQDCPSPEQIWAAVHGELPPARALALISHTATCPTCAEDWRLAAVLHEHVAGSSGAPVNGGTSEEARVLAPERREWVPTRYLRPSPGRPVAAAHPLPSWSYRLAAAALAAVLLIAMGIELGRQQRLGHIARGDSAAEKLLVADGQILKRESCLLTWSGPENGSYSVQVETMSGRTLAEARELRARSYVVPQSALTSVPSGARLEWQVSATLPAGGIKHSRRGNFVLDR
jgi:hypothetical protein